MIIDILLVIFLVSAFIHGFRRGLIHSVFAFIALFFGLMLSVKFSNELSRFLYDSFSVESKFLPLLSFILVFMGVLIVFNTLSHLLHKIAETLFLGLINKMIGGILWCLIMIMVFSTLLWFFNQMDLISAAVREQSRTYNFLITLAPLVIDFIANLLPYFKGMFDSIENLFREAPAKEGLQAVVSL